MHFDKIWVVNEAKLYPKLVEALSQGKAVIHDGVAYWAEGSGNTGVIQHLPFKEAQIQGVEQALQLAQATTVIATAVSTSIILAAIVVQTRYLARKLDKIQAAVDLIAKDVHAQNILFYMDKVTEYVGCVETARTLLKDRSLADDMRELAIPLVATLSGKRNQVLFFIDHILSLASASKDVTPKHFELIVNFAHLMLEVMPFGVHVEYLLVARMGKPRLAEQVLLDGAERFGMALETYREFMNGLHREFVRGNLGERADVYQLVEARAKRLFKDEGREALLSLPLGRVEPLLRAA